MKMADKKKSTGKKMKPKTKSVYSGVKTEAKSMRTTTTLATPTTATFEHIDDTNIYVAEQSLTAEIALSNEAAPVAAAVVVFSGTNENRSRNTQTTASTSTQHPKITTAVIPSTSQPIELDPEPAAQPLAVVVHSNRHRIETPAIESAVAASTSAQEKLTSTSQRGGAGMFVLVGITIGMFVTLLVVQVYRCAARRSTQRARRFDGCEEIMDSANTVSFGHLDAISGETARRWRGREFADGKDVDDDDDDDVEQYAPSSGSSGNYRDMLPMELLGAAAAATSTIQYSEAPIELW